MRYLCLWLQFILPFFSEISYTLPMNAKWAKIAEILKGNLDSGSFRIWISPLDAEISGTKMNILVPNEYMAEWLKKRLLSQIRAAAAMVLEQDEKLFSITFTVREPSGQKQSVHHGADIVKDVMADTEAKAGFRERLPIGHAKVPSNPGWRYSFEDFVTGPSNNLAVAAAMDMCKQGQVRTLFINSGPGLGKTHLAQSAGQALTSSSSLKIAYLTGEQFASRFVAAMRDKTLEDFKQYLCGLDALLMEDIHFLQRKKAMQEMALGVIKNLQAKGARVIFTSSFGPRQLQDMDSQLISLFCEGILANMEKPDCEMRKEILRRKAKTWQVILPEEVCDALSSRLASDVRQLEACLKNMIFKAKLLHSGLTLDLALETASQYAGAENIIDIKGIVRLVCESFGLTEMQLKSSSKKRDYVQGRNTVFYLARKHTDLSLEEIGCIFNRRHSTVLRSITQVEQELAMDSRQGRQLAHTVELIERKYGLCD